MSIQSFSVFKKRQIYLSFWFCYDTMIAVITMRGNTKAIILDTARQMFNEYGYLNVTMRQISNQLNISVGNLTYHYKKKEDILKALMRSVDIVYEKNPVMNLKDLHMRFDAMLDSLINNLFFFISTELSDIEPEFAENNRRNVNQLRFNLVEGINQLKQLHYFTETFNEITIQAQVTLIMMAHLNWARQYHHPGAFNHLDKKQFLLVHWQVLAPYFTEQAQKEYQQMLSTIFN